MSETFVALAHTPHDIRSNPSEWTVGDKSYVDFWANRFAKEYSHVFIGPVGPLVEEE